ncbi:MAG: ABC transporter permease subunit [Jaaginema sp. PMC 1079.18]|nr:ABC transporter permease subunit [Jaaginema sp. PMC 1080.18]MEC4851327.1 ABC transporter permease subunit [Jaaginema sp. PMC 1079.18]MEC4865860.1 ABC transporter permease subunit [Jaaginema sp. PMC 1078.18]
MNYLSRIGAIAFNGFRAGLRDRVLYWIGFFALLWALALRILPDISATYADKILLDVGLGLMGVLSAIAVIFLGSQLIPQEIERRTILILLPKPLSRAELIVGKHLGLLGVAIALVLGMMAVYGLGLAIQQITFSPLNLWLSGVYLVLELGVLIAVALFFSVFTGAILATLLTLGIYLVGQGSDDLLALGQLSNNTSLQKLLQTLYIILPDLSRLNPRNDLVYGIVPSGLELGLDLVYAVAYIVALLAIAIIIFNRRQF